MRRKVALNSCAKLNKYGGDAIDCTCCARSHIIQFWNQKRRQMIITTNCEFQLTWCIWDDGDQLPTRWMGVKPGGYLLKYYSWSVDKFIPEGTNIWSAYIPGPLKVGGRYHTHPRNPSFPLVLHPSFIAIMNKKCEWITRLRWTNEMEDHFRRDFWSWGQCCPFTIKWTR